MNGLTTVQQLAVSVLPILFGITVHEVAHGWVANRCGDRTAKILGRLTLNPINHIDIIGTICVPILLYWISHGQFIFGWAKPVPVNVANLRNPRRDSALVSVAGPASNLLMALIWGLIAKLGVILLNQNIGWALAIVYMGQLGVLFNIVLMVLNLIPIPPLDGSHIVSSLLPLKMAIYYESIAPYGMFILLALLVTRVLSLILWPIVMFIVRIIFMIMGI